MKTPGRHRQALVTWALVYPLITAVLAVLEPWLSEVPLPLRTLILSAIMVPVMSYAAMPFVTAHLGGWMAGQVVKKETKDA